MLAAQRIGGGSSQGQLEELLEMVLAQRGRGYERRVLASTLRVLADWLNEQARLIQIEEDDRRLANGTTELLTRRERQIAERIARGLSNRQIAQELVITLSTTERHVANILAKLNMRSRAQVAAWAVEHGVA
jgi:DNA-binding NarL/FixJ family response regulator